jgi:hypothetical protein
MIAQLDSEYRRVPTDLAPLEEPWRVLEGFAEFSGLPPQTPSAPSTDQPFPGPVNVERHDTVETPVDVQRHIATVVQMPAVTVTTEIRRPALPLVPLAVKKPVDEDRLLVRIAVGAVSLACFIFIAALLWPEPAPAPVGHLPPRLSLPPPAPPKTQPVASVPKAPDEWTLDPRRHRVDTLAVHAPDITTHPRHRYLLSAEKLPKGAVVSARLDDVREGQGALYGLAPGRVLSVHGVKAIRLHCEPPEAFTAQTTLDVQLVDTATHETRLVTLRPDRDCLDLSAARSVRLTEPVRVGLPGDSRRPVRMVYWWRGPDGSSRAGMLVPGQGVRVEPGVVQLAVVSHSVSDTEPIPFQVGPPDVEPTQRQVQYLTPSLKPVREPEPPKPILKTPEPDVWPRNN